MVTRRRDGIIEWACGSCLEQGIIHHWENTYWDCRNLQGNEEDTDEILNLRLAGKSYAVLLDARVSLFREDEAFVLRAAARGDEVVLVGSGDEFEELLVTVAGEINHAPNRYWRRKLERIYDEIKAGLTEAGRG